MRQTTMQFSGGEHRFTRADVLEAARDVTPDRIVRYYVELHGRRNPPKQVIRLVTGTRKRFNAANARSALTRLGFTIRAV